MAYYSSTLSIFPVCTAPTSVVTYDHNKRKEGTSLENTPQQIFSIFTTYPNLT